MKQPQRELARLRGSIDRIDRGIVTSLNARMRLAKRVASAKEALGLPAYAPDREEKHLRELGTRRGKLDRLALRSIFREIMSAARAAEANEKVAYFGPEASFTHLAARARFGASATLLPVPSIPDVFGAVERGDSDYGVVPAENSTDGVVNHTYDMLMDSELKICAEELIPIRHYLMSRAGSMGKIRTVYSRQIIFAQCRKWLEDNLRGARLVEVNSSSEGAKIASKTRGAAAIGTALAASMYGLKVMAEGIEDMAGNSTRFFVIGERWSRPTGHDKTSVMLSVHDRVGALHRMLGTFTRNGINLTSIESRPSRKKAWDYYFFIDFTGHAETPKPRKALAELARQCPFLKILGSYPAADRLSR